MGEIVHVDREGQARAEKGREGFRDVRAFALEVGWVTLIFKTWEWASDKERRLEIFEIIFRGELLIFSPSTSRANPFSRAVNACEMGNGDLDSIIATPSFSGLIQ